MRSRMKVKVSTIRRKWALGVLAILTLATSTCWRSSRQLANERNSRVEGERKVIQKLPGLLTMPAEKLREMDIAQMNLFCAQGLPGVQDLEVSHPLAGLDEITTRVCMETERHFYRFQQNPVEFQDSEGFFRMLMLTVVLTEDFRITYDPTRKVTG